MSEEQTKKNKFAKPKRKRIIKRKPGTISLNYFGQDTQDSIVKYQKEDNQEDKKKIYVKEVLPAFDSLTENLINVYGFKITHESKKDLKSECLEFLYRTVPKFDEEKGSKAFSYFNVVAKNWLTIRSKQNVKRIKTYISADDRESFTEADLDLFESHNIVPSYEELIAINEQGKLLKDTLDKMREKVKTDNEKLCLNAIEQIVENLDDIDILNKRAILLYIREITGLSSKQLSVVLSSLKKRYKEMKKLGEND